MSKEQALYLKKRKRKKIVILLSQISLLIAFIFSWEYASSHELINSFIFSSPSEIIKTLITLYKENNLFIHIYVTSLEVIVSFLLSVIISFFLALFFYIFPTIKKIMDPFITMINSLPKVALGPLIIIWMGANTKSIIFMALLINLIVTFTTILNGFLNTDKDKIKLFKVLNASKKDIIFKLIIPSSRNEVISALRLNLSLSLIGVIMGEFLSCKKGIGYLILYGTQVFNLSLVMCGIFLLLLLSFIFYELINVIDKKLFQKDICFVKKIKEFE